MARESQTTQVAVGYLLDPVLTAPTAEGDIVDSGDVRVWVHNGSGAPITVTAVAVGMVEGLDVEDLTESVPAGADVLIGPFPKSVLGQGVGADKGRVHVNYSSVTDVTRAVVRP